MKLVGHAILVVGVAALLSAAVNLKQAWEIEDLQKYLDALTVIVSEDAAYLEAVHGTAIEAMQSAVIANRRLDYGEKPMFTDRQMLSVVRVIVLDAKGGEAYHGSGFVTDFGVVTASHVLDDMYPTDSLVLQFADGAIGAATIEIMGGRSPGSTDMAVLYSAAATDYPSLELECRRPTLSEELVLVGNPRSMRWVANPGRVASLYSHAKEPSAVWVATQVNEGQSGGPVLSRDGKVVGIVMSNILFPGQDSGNPFSQYMTNSGLAGVLPGDSMCAMLESVANPSPAPLDGR